MSTEHMPGATCGCCSGVTARTPRSHANRPGLPVIAYRSGTHRDFLASMLAGLTAADRPRLAELRSRDEDDPTIALLDAWAVASDVLTFYTERLANESYLTTARERNSLRELGALVAYRLHPGAAADTHLAFSLERPPPQPEAQADPGLLPPVVPASLLVAPGLRVQSVPGPGEKPQTFETIEPLEARPEWNALRIRRTTPRPPTTGRSDAWFAGSSLNLRRGDAILFVYEDAKDAAFDLRLLTEVEPDPPNDRTHVRWQRGLESPHPDGDSAAATTAFVLRKRVPVFGHNAPIWRSMNQEFRISYCELEAAGSEACRSAHQWPKFQGVQDKSVDLDGSHQDVVPDSWVVLSEEVEKSHVALYRVAATSELSRAAFAISAKVTRLELEGDEPKFGTPRDVTVFAVSEPLQLVEAPDPADVTGSSLVVDGDATAMLPGRSVVVAGRASNDSGDLAELGTVKEAVPEGANRTRIELTASLSGTFRRDSAVVLGNVARATHGETVHQILGDGAAGRPSQQFPLRQLPLTYIQADTPDGIATTLEVRVDGAEWQEVKSLYGRGPSERVFVTRPAPDDVTVVAFGDGRTGARLPTGSHNVRATYRKGLGAAGNVDRAALSQPLDRPLGLKAVTNPLPARGGLEPEAEAHARAGIPLAVRTLGRAVSLRDYEDYALAFTGVAKASAAVHVLPGGRTVVVTVATNDDVDASGDSLLRLTSSLSKHGDPRVRLQVVPYRPATFRLGLRVRLDPTRDRKETLHAVEASLRAAFSFDARSFGQAVHLSEVIAVAAAVPGVDAVDLDLLYRGAAPQLAARLVAEPSSVDAGGGLLAAELLTLATAPFDSLEEMP